MRELVFVLDRERIHPQSRLALILLNDRLRQEQFSRKRAMQYFECKRLWEAAKRPDHTR